MTFVMNNCIFVAISSGDIDNNKINKMNSKVI